jgi:transketolase
MRNHFANWLTQNAEALNLYLITGDLGFGVFEDFISRHPHRFFNAGVAEQSMIGIASGLSSFSSRIYVYSIGNFASLRCLEQIRNDLAYMNKRVTVVSVGSGFAYGAQGYTHHAIEDLAAVRAIGNLSVYSPADTSELEVILRVDSKSTGPSFLRLGRGGEPNLHVVPDIKSLDVPIEILQGSDGVIFFHGSIGVEVLKARSKLEEYGVFVAVYSCPVLTPKVDFYSILAKFKEKTVLVVEENVRSGGLVSLILEQAMGRDLNLQNFHSLCVNQELVHTLGSQDYLRRQHGIDFSSIVCVFHSSRTDQ